MSTQGTWTPNIPSQGQKLGNTRDPIRNNFTAAFNAMAADHFSFGQPNFGRHNKIRFPKVQTQSPGTGTNEYAVYTKTVGSLSQVFCQGQGQAPGGADFQLTAPFLAPNTGQNGVGSFTNYSFMPGGFLRIFGAAMLTVNNQKITLGYQTSAMYSLQLTVNTPNPLVGGAATVNSNQLILNDGGSTTFRISILPAINPAPYTLYFDVIAGY